MIKDAGGDQNAYTATTSPTTTPTSRPRTSRRILEVEADRFQNLSYSEEQFRTEALAVKGEYLKNYSNPLLKGFERLADLAFDRHTYGHTTMGVFEDIEAMPDQMDYAKDVLRALVPARVRQRDRRRRRRPRGDAGPGREVLGRAGSAATTASRCRSSRRARRPRYEHIEWEGPTLPWLLDRLARAGLHDVRRPTPPALVLLGEIYFGADLGRSTSSWWWSERWADQLFALRARRPRSRGCSSIARHA